MDVLARVLDIPVAGSGFVAILGWMNSMRERLRMPHALQGGRRLAPELAELLAPPAVADPSMGGSPIPANEEDCERLFPNALEGNLRG